MKGFFGSRILISKILSLQSATNSVCTISNRCSVRCNVIPPQNGTIPRFNFSGRLSKNIFYAEKLFIFCSLLLVIKSRVEKDQAKSLLFYSDQSPKILSKLVSLTFIGMTNFLLVLLEFL